jgi:predicted aspartyl protease
MASKFKIPVQIIELDRKSFHILINAKLNGLTVNLLIDTGASRTVFDKSLLGKKMKLDKKTVDGEIQSAGIMAGRIETLSAVAKSFKLGRLKLKHYPVVLIDLESINNLYTKVAGKHIHGLLGSDFLLEMNAVINYEKAHLILKTV